MNPRQIDPAALLAMAKQAREKAAATRREASDQCARASEIAGAAGETLFRYRVERFHAPADANADPHQ